MTRAPPTRCPNEPFEALHPSGCSRPVKSMIPVAMIAPRSLLRGSSSFCFAVSKFLQSSVAQVVSFPPKIFPVFRM